VSLAGFLKGSGPSGFGYSSTAEDVTNGLNLEGCTVLVTGCGSGLGKETVRVLAARGARILAATRSLEKSRAVCAELGGEAVPLECDLANPRSVLACVAAVEALGVSLDALICNAGIMALPRLEQAFGYELQFFTNHIGHFLLVTRLVPRLGDAGRVVMLSSDAQRFALGRIPFDNLSGERGYQPWMAYGQSKLANLLFAKELAKRLPPRQSANAVHPGVIQTELQRSMSSLLRLGMKFGQPLFLKTIAQGAATQCYVAVHPNMTQNGEYFADCNVVKATRAARDAALAQELWDVSERIVSEVTR
jgi:WW domain-containing oxidoreductase